MGSTGNEDTQIAYVLAGDPDGEHLHIRLSGSDVIMTSVEYVTSKMGLSNYRDRILFTIPFDILDRAVGSIFDERVAAAERMSQSVMELQYADE